VKLPEDPFVRELLPEFIDTWIQDINEQFDDLILSKNADDLYRFGHTLKGSCFQFGIDDVATLGIELMGLAKNQDWENAAIMGERLKSTFNEAKEFVQNSH